VATPHRHNAIVTSLKTAVAVNGREMPKHQCASQPKKTNEWRLSSVPNWYTGGLNVCSASIQGRLIMSVTVAVHLYGSMLHSPRAKSRSNTSLGLRMILLPFGASIPVYLLRQVVLRWPKGLPRNQVLNNWGHGKACWRPDLDGFLAMWHRPWTDEACGIRAVLFAIQRKKPKQKSSLVQVN
jgi:hypothetical protein